MPAFSQPWWLLLAPLLLYAVWRIHRNSFAEGSVSRRWFWLLVRSVLVLLLVICLAGFQMRVRTNQKQVVFLLDVSDSISPEQRELAVRWINDSIQTIHSPDQVGIIVFGADAAVERFPAQPYPLSTIESRVDSSATNLENAVKLADELFAENYEKNLVILSDGLENAGKVSEAMASLKTRGVSVQALYLQPLDHSEAGIESVRFADEIRLKETFPLDIVIASNRHMPALLQVFRNEALLQEGTVLLEQNNKQLIRLPQKILAPGVYRYEVRLKPKEDFSEENNTLEGWVSVQGPPQILLVDENPEALQPLKKALEDRGFEVDLKAIPNFPFDLQEMLMYQAIFIRNVPASRIHAQMPMLQQYVRDFGGGFAMLGGKSSFGPGGYYQTPAETILPVRMDLVNKKYLADVAMVIVIDKSGSMSLADRGRQKIDLADEGGARVASLLKSTDQLGVLAVDSVPKWAFNLQKLAKRDDAIDAITSIRAGGGGIYVYSGLREAYRELKEAKASVKHVILFADTADCEEKEGPMGDSSLALGQATLRDSKITTTTIGIGQPGDTDVEFLRQLAAIGQGRFYFTNDMYTLPEIFTQESAIVQRYYINEERFAPRLVETEPVLSGIDSVPDLLGYVATTAKPGATIALVSSREDPVFAFWRYGFGQAVAFTSDPTASWGAPWLTWHNYERFWAQTGRLLARSNTPAHFRTSFGSNGNHTIVVVEALDEQGAFLNNAQFAGALIDRSGTQFPLQFSQVAPGRYEAVVPSGNALFGKIYRLDAGKIQEESIVQIAGRANREFEPSFYGKERLIRLTGKIVDSPVQLHFSARASEEIHPLRDRILLWVSFLLLLDVAARKIDFHQLTLVPSRTVAEPASAPALLQLKDRKRQVRAAQIPLKIYHQDLRSGESQTVEASGTVQEDRAAPSAEEYLERLKAIKRKTE